MVFKRPKCYQVYRYTPQGYTLKLLLHMHTHAHPTFLDPPPTYLHHAHKRPQHLRRKPLPQALGPHLHPVAARTQHGPQEVIHFFICGGCEEVWGDLVACCLCTGQLREGARACAQVCVCVRACVCVDVCTCVTEEGSRGKPGIATEQVRIVSPRRLHYSPHYHFRCG